MAIKRVASASRDHNLSAKLKAGMSPLAAIDDDDHDRSLQTPHQSTSDGGSMQQNLDLSLNYGGGSSLNNVGSTADPHKVYACCYCTRTFSSTQALGGHQNAHRRERFLTKWDFYNHQDVVRRLGNHHSFGSSPYSHHPSLPALSHLGMLPPPPPPPPYNVNIRGFVHVSPLGVKMNSMIHKKTWPTSPNIGTAYRLGYAHSRRPASSRLVESVDGLRMMNNNNLRTNLPISFLESSLSSHDAARTDVMDMSKASDIDLSLKL